MLKAKVVDAEVGGTGKLFNKDTWNNAEHC